MISLRGVRFGYGEKPVLDGLDLEVPRGQLLGVIGPNGAGKSTLVRLLLGLHRPHAGRVLVDGVEAHAPGREARRAFARKVGAVVQDEALEFPFTAREVVLMGRIAHLPPLGFERAADLDAADRALAETDTRALADRPLHTLSGGERKRVFLARALAQDPELLILDEPVAALDLSHQLAIFDLLRARHQRGGTVIVVVHDLNLAAAYCERLLLVRPHAPALHGTVEDILTAERVRETFGVEAWIGENPLSGARVLIPVSRR